MAQKLHPKSATGALPELDVFTVPPTQSLVAKTFKFEIKPVAALKIHDNNVIDFEVRSGEDEYIRMETVELFLKIRVNIVKNEDGANKASADDWLNISPVNNLLHSMIKQTEIYIGDTKVCANQSEYAYKAYFEKRLALLLRQRNHI